MQGHHLLPPGAHFGGHSWNAQAVQMYVDDSDDEKTWKQNFPNLYKIGKPEQYLQFN